MNWLQLAACAALGMALYNLFIKAASGQIHQMVGAVVLQVVAALIGVGLLLLLYLRGTLPATLVTSRGITLAALAGVSIGVAEILTFAVYAKGAPAAVGTPLIVGGSVLLTALLGVLVLREALAWPQALGLLLVVGGIALLSRGH
ncbi:EamA family transporter [Hymenobacter tibetensis]|uniref:EamA family transporter n=1 Tax=Hymenobacter tibetensis TaxID=497967 RepID=A0ABY4CRG2_9BACT|nr:EamA family transporter [Hymenobacter tibetensis]UOG72751.1 EamA family transporter [Hymenobacter tibetensis]